jgi:hypothetical protein
MTSNRLRNSLTAALAFTVAATLTVGSAFAADGDNGKFKRRGSNGQLKTGTFQIVVPKADRNDRSDRGAEGPAWRWTDCCHGRAAEAFRPATACARIRPDARQGRAGRFCSSSG